MTNAAASTSSSTTANALSLLLREDPRLLELNLTSFADTSPLLLSSSSQLLSPGSIVSPNEEAAFAFAAALMHEDSSPEISGWISPSIQDSGSDVQSRAKEALADVDRKLALVSGLAERLVRDHPDQVSEKLLRLHGFSCTASKNSTEAVDAGAGDDSEQQQQQSALTLASKSPNNNLVALRAKCDRLTRQSLVMESIANRVQLALQKQYDKLRDCTTRLQRVLALSSTLKMAMRLQFESKKILGCGINLSILEDQQSTAARSKALVDVDLRDLTRAASSVAVMETLLKDPELYGGTSTNFNKVETLDIVNTMRPEVEKAALAVRRLAASLLAEQQSLHGASTSSSTLGGILQIYFHLNELPQAVWSAVSSNLTAAEKAAAEIFNPKMIQRLRETALSEAKAALSDAEQQPVDSTGAAGGTSNIAGGSAALRKKKQTEHHLERLVAKKIKEERAALASRWVKAVGEATAQISMLQRVLFMKSDPGSRQNFLQVVAASGEVPNQFIQAQKYLEQHVHSGGTARNKITAQLHILNLFWTQMSLSLGNRLSRLLRYENGKLVEEVAALYPALRAASLSMLSTMGEDSDKARRTDNDGIIREAGGVGTGILGGSSLLEDDFGKTVQAEEGVDSTGRGVFAGTSADSWTCDSSPEENSQTVAGSTNSQTSSPSAILGGGSSSSSINRFEWKILAGEFGSRRGGAQGNETVIGLSALQLSFIETSSERLCAPLPYLFQQQHTILDASDAEGLSGVAALPSLPSRYDLANIESLVREHLSLADPRQGGGEFGMVALLCDNVNDMVLQFLAAAQDATSGAAEKSGDTPAGASEIGEAYLRGDDLSATEALAHDVNLAGVISALSQAIQGAPDSAFLAPYRPSQSAQHEEAARLSKVALIPSLKAMNSVVNKSVLNPLCRAINQRLSIAFAKMHLGAYLEDSRNTTGEGFVQSHLNLLYERISSNHLAKFPSEYGYRVASTIATYSMYAFVSNISLVRPLGEVGRLKITQDLADLELALEQLALVTGGGETVSSSSSSPLAQIEGGKPYAELRAVRSMIFWQGLDSDKSSSKTASEIAAELLAEEWIKDVRPSTVLHFLFSFAPDLLSSPHHSKRISAQEYVSTLVRYDGSVEDANAWMTIMACCDAYQQRESVEGATTALGSTASGDRRIASVLMVLGSELLRRRR